MGKIIKRYYINAKIRMETPLAISNGEKEYTDSDVLKNSQGKIFIPGTALAGAFRNFLDCKKTKKCSFGYSSKNKDGSSEIDEGSMSSVFISDVYFDDTTVSVRDGVSLNENKTVENKFDYEIIEAGKTSELKIERIVREDDDDRDNALNETAQILYGLNSGDIRLGSKKNRGFGWIKVTDVYLYEFDKNNVSEWIEYCKKGAVSDEKNRWDDWKNDTYQTGKYFSIKIPLRLQGGISIRKYSTKPNEADYEHITAKGEDGERLPVIPGTSWNGAIRAGIKDILRALGISETDTKIKSWFGYVDKVNDKAHQSNIIIKESVLRGSTMLPISRNRVNRFDASTVDGALYSEISYFGGETELEILVRNLSKDNDFDDYASVALMGAVILAIEEICQGYIAIGGQTAVGRGIFEKNGEIQYGGNISREDCLKELALLKDRR